MSEKILTCCHDTGPFFAHIHNGQWEKSSPTRARKKIQALNAKPLQRVFDTSSAIYYTGLPE